MNHSTRIEISEFLLDQFEAICEFENSIARGQSMYRVGTIKTWWYQGRLHIIDQHPNLREACTKLESRLPLDHPYWSSVAGVRYD